MDRRTFLSVLGSPAAPLAAETENGPRLSTLLDPESTCSAARGVGHGEDQLGMTGLSEEPADVRQRGDQRLAGHRHIDVPRRLVALGCDARGPVALDESDQSTLARVVDAAAAPPIAHGRVHHETRGRFTVGGAIPVHLTDDSSGKNHIAAPRKGDDPDWFAEPRWRGRAGGHAFVALRSEEGHVEVGALAESHNAAALLRAGAPLTAEEEVDCLPAYRARHRVTACEHEALRAPTLRTGGDHHARSRSETPPFRMLEDDLDGRRQQTIENVLAAGFARRRDDATCSKGHDCRPGGQRSREHRKVSQAWQCGAHNFDHTAGAHDHARRRAPPGHEAHGMPFAPWGLVAPETPALNVRCHADGGKEGRVCGRSYGS